MAEHRSPSHPSELGWFEREANIRKIIHALYIVCALLLIADLLYEKHGHFAFEEWFGFFAFYGFLSYCFIVFSAKGLRRLIKRDEHYYD